MQPLEPHYHKLTFELLGVTPAPSKAALRKMTAWEICWNMKLPAAVREWYAFEEAWQHLNNEDRTVEEWYVYPLQDFLRRIVKAPLPTASDDDLILPVFSHSTGHGFWARLGPSEDPLVGWGEEVSYAEEVTYAEEPYSVCLFKWCWTKLTYWVDPYDHPEKSANTNFYLEAEGSCCGPVDLDYLKEHFREGVHTIVKDTYRKGRSPRTGEPITVIVPSLLRFFMPGARVQVDCEGDPHVAEVKATWRISADTADGLVNPTNPLWRWRDLAAKLSSPTRAGKAVLRRLRRARGG
jgi:hypothetical protein